MLELPRWKYVLIALVLMFGVLYALPNLYPQDPAVQISANRGGSVDDALKTRVENLLAEEKLQAMAIEVGADNLLVRMANPDVQLRAADYLREKLGRSYVVALNLASTVPDWLRFFGASPMNLGLDLQGGVHFLMEVDQRAAIDKRENAYADDIRTALRDAKIGYNTVNRTLGQILVELRDAADVAAFRSLMTRENPQLQVIEGAAPEQIIVRVTDADLAAITNKALEQNIGTLRNRINELGVAEPIIQRQGASRIVVQLPGVQDTAQAKKVLGATATLEYRAQVDGDAYEAARSGRVPPDARLYYRRDLGPDGKPIPVLLSRRIIASGDQLIDAVSGNDPQGGGPMVSVTLNSAGGKRMFDFTSENVGRGMAVVFVERTPEVRLVDGKEVRTARITEEVVSVAAIRGVFGKQFQTTGLDSIKEASQLALLLRAGSLAAPVDIVEERVIGPSLGQDNIDAGKRAIVIGFLAVCVLMIFYYHLFGVISVIALFSNLLLLAAVLSLAGATLTMPGIAGIVLTLGMAIDGNVLIAERIREELRNGNTPVSSIRSGYERAWTVILDSNVTKLIASIALFSFGSGPVRGFAVVLFVGVLTSMFTSVTVSRALATLVYGGGRKVKSVSV
ncbi:MAG: protein translocase subunit SecD [Xanthomonadaceae bacterium]|nr:protein translocase subunit SecD [Xanthomonadaceae bacterium]MDP2185764.1 protein translocase subunit SecD [Xanthomonadales bacterium]MDZ4115048.1 protein translocase subunit SecD [Xanthomonadaceae bacterium]MDZ4376828.1 protein translocase subunit SecD [Xanthomonadaceae bacterium]